MEIWQTGLFFIIIHAAVNDAELSKAGGAAMQQYCNTELFNPQCEEDENIIVTKATYGRMSVGKCLSENFGYMGCGSDVLPELDSFCSGRSSCKFVVDDRIFQRPKRCHKDLKSYLETSYRCQKVVVPNNDCAFYSKVMVTRPEGYLSSLITEQTKCGSTESPWIIKLEPGQRINLTLYDFSYFNFSTSLEKGMASPTICKVYATIRDSGSARRSTTICGGKHRVQHVYLSQTHQVEVRILGKSGNHPPPSFILHYKALGCPSLVEDNDYWVKQKNTVASMGCKADSTEWTLTCDGTKWIGNFHNCTSVTPFLQNVVGSVSQVPYGEYSVLSMVIIATIAVGIGCAILAVGVICIKRRLKPNQTPSTLPHKTTATYPHDGQLPNDKYATPVNVGMPARPGDQMYHSNEYASMRLLPPIPESHHDRHMIQNRPGHISPDHIYESPDSIRRIYEGIGQGNEDKPGVGAVVDNNWHNTYRTMGSTGYPSCNTRDFQAPDNPPPHYFDIDPRGSNAVCSGRCSKENGWCTCAQTVQVPQKCAKQSGRKNTDTGTYSV